MQTSHKCTKEISCNVKHGIKRLDRGLNGRLLKHA